MGYGSMGPLLLAILIGGGSRLAAERALDPSEATVFIRVIGRIEVAVDSPWDESREERDVELGTGSGFVFTRFGQVLTNHHVIAGGSLKEQVSGREVDVDLRVDRIEVVLPSPSGEPARLQAVVEATDPERDLAILSVSGADLPYLAFGDSDALAPGESATVYGFPFGRRVEVGRAELADIVPEVSVSRGAVAATRRDDTGGAAYLQTSAVVNPGNSGGPMLDGESFVLGVVRLRLRGGDGIGFAIPVNEVKDFLEERGYGNLLPVTRLTLGAEQGFPGKGLTLRLPGALEDVSPTRLAVRAETPEREVRLDSDRMFTPWELARLERALLSGELFGGFRATTTPGAAAFAGGRVLLGSASGVDESGRPTKILYALFENGLEKIAVRYAGSAEAVAFNRAVLQESLRSLELESLYTSPVARMLAPEDLPLVARPLPDPAAPAILFPGDWLEEVSAPFPCAGAPDSALSASPPGDFTLSFRSAWWRRGPRASEAAKSCGGNATEPTYAYRVEWLGVTYAVSGRFQERGEALIQLEVVSPLETEPLLREAGRAWLAQPL